MAAIKGTVQENSFVLTVSDFTHADDSRGSIAFICVCLCEYLCVYAHDRTKTAETTITKLATGYSTL